LAFRPSFNVVERSGQLSEPEIFSEKSGDEEPTIGGQKRAKKRPSRYQFWGPVGVGKVRTVIIHTVKRYSRKTVRELLPKLRIGVCRETSRRRVKIRQHDSADPVGCVAPSNVLNRRSPRQCLQCCFEFQRPCIKFGRLDATFKAL